MGRAIRILPADIDAYQQDANPHAAPGRFSRLRELEVLEKMATSDKLNVVPGEKGLGKRVVNLL